MAASQALILKGNIYTQIYNQSSCVVQMTMISCYIILHQLGYWRVYTKAQLIQGVYKQTNNNYIVKCSGLETAGDPDASQVPYSVVKRAEGYLTDILTVIYLGGSEHLQINLL